MVYLNEGPKIGVLMLDTSFKRPVGDIGNPETFPFPLAYRVVKNAIPDSVVKRPDQSLVSYFARAAKELEEDGVKAITTSCGFLALFQKKIQADLSIPFFSSSLMQIPLVHAITGGETGVLTARKESLTDEHFKNINVHRTMIAVEGMDNMRAFTEAIITQTAQLDEKAVTDELKQATSRLMSTNPDVRAIVLECTNMPPYKKIIKQTAGVPVFDINTLVSYVHASL
ncbi:aspartate/glutamate racemase family protein [Virgibacillus kekensis]|uniref:Aspartate/glutamate racemase family protein n=1 Tax=Virgibacillus kekensis TaxID=202261 RepID=A0ABV9DND2_9BACI